MEVNKLKRVEDLKGRVKDIIGNDGIIQLAKDGICPHYIITNPLTKEESIWFDQGEIGNWLSKNFVRYNEGYFTQRYVFYNFTPVKRSGTENVPNELIKIDPLYELPLEHINTPPGVYFLCLGQKIQYIGKANNIANRILIHITQGTKEFDRVFYVLCPINRLTELESSMIKLYKPPLNRACLPKQITKPS